MFCPITGQPLQNFTLALLVVIANTYLTLSFFFFFSQSFFFYCFIFYFYFLSLIFIQCLNITFHLQLLQNIGSIPCVVQYISEPILIVCASHPLPLHCFKMN